MQISQRTEYGAGKFIAAIVVGVLIFVFLANPKFTDYRERAKQLKADTELETKLRSEDKEITRRLAELETREDQVKLLEAAIPDKAGIPDLYAYLETLIKTSNLTLSSIQAVDATAAKEADGATPTDAVVVSSEVPQAPSPSLGVIMVNLELKGDINGYKQFLGAIEKSLRIMDVQTVEISDDTQSLTYRITLKTYYQK
jgi:Tfp pilus assembly protein PilO